MKKTERTTEQEVSDGGIPEGYSALLISPTGELMVAIPKRSDHEVVSSGAKLAAALAFWYSEEENATTLMQSIFGGEEDEINDVRQLELSFMCNGGTIH